MLKHALAILSLVAVPLSTLAETTTADTTHAMDRLADKYSSLAGSKENAQKLVTGLHEGGDIKIGSETIKTPTDKMGVGNVNIALALTEAKLGRDGHRPVDGHEARRPHAARGRRARGEARAPCQA